MRKANPKVVGGFVIVAVLLAMTAVVIFGGGGFFKDKRTFVAYFPGSLSGLRIGAPVEFRGVQVGTVTDLWVEVNPKTLEFTLPVVMEIERSRIRGVESADRARPAAMKDLIEDGFRAQLQATSFVTGQQGVQLDFHKDTEINLVESDLPYEQIPTIPSQIEVVKSALDQIAEKSAVVLDRVEQLLSKENQEAVGETLKNTAALTSELTEAAVNLNVTVANIGEIVREIEGDLPLVRRVLETGDATLLSYKQVAETADGVLSENRKGIQAAVAGLNRTERRVAALVDTANKLLEENRRGISEFTNDGLYEISNLAVDAQGAVEQLRRVLEELERDPARFLLGEPGQVEVK